MRMTAAVLDANEQDRLFAQLTRAGVEHRVGRVGPVPGREDRVVGMAMEQFRDTDWVFRFSMHRHFLDDCFGRQ